jgi:ABC-type transport system substrate-binding protein
MVSHYMRLRVRRKMRTRKKQVVGMGESANKQLDRHIFRRWHNLKTSWRFVTGWLSLIILLVIAVVFQVRTLGSFYLEASPIAGGEYSEGIVGSFNNANPIYATSAVDAAVSRLVFSPLLTYDANNQLTGDLAASWDVDARATIYTVVLKPNLVWQDGKPLTSDDVVFTFQTIQNLDAKSPLSPSWRGVKIEKLDTKTPIARSCIR